MNVQMVEGLLGASSSVKLSGTPMSVYRQASIEGDAEKMKRAMGYTGECTEKAVKYQEKLDKGMEAEAKEEREKAKLEREAAIERRREERRRAEEGRETARFPDADVVQISEVARAALEDRAPEAAEPLTCGPVLYAEDGGISAPVSAAWEESESGASFTATA